MVLITQSCLILCDPMDCSPPGSSVHGILQVRILEWVAHALLQGIFQSQGLNLGLPNSRQILYHLSHQGSSTEEARTDIQAQLEGLQREKVKGEGSMWTCYLL